MEKKYGSIADKAKLAKALGGFKTRKICVIGDVMLDRFIFGDTDRISPEAPVPVVRQKREIFMPGGAGNVANNLSALGSGAYLVGLIGNDPAGKKLVSIFKNKKVDTGGLVVSVNRPTTEKIRVIARNQQIIRIDREEDGRIKNGTEKKMLDFITKNISKWHCVIISDYDKGLLSESLVKNIIKLAKKSGVFVVADTKNKNIAHYKGVTIITPNKKESENITGTVEVDKAGRKIAKLLDSKVLVTEGSEGMSLFDSGKVIKFPALAQEVYDVTGAGDTVASVLALALSSGLTAEESVMLSNLAAGIVVGKVGTATVKTDEIEKYLLNRDE